MKLGCLIVTVFYGALVVTYRRWLSRTLDSEFAAWGIACGVGFVAFLCLAALYEAWRSWWDSRVVAAAARGQPTEPGRWCAVSGTLQPIGPTLNAPFSGTPCVAFEFEIARITEVTGATNRGTPSKQRVVDYAGLVMTPAAIRSDTESVRIYGPPELEAVPKVTCAEPGDRDRAIAFVQSTTWLDGAGSKAIGGMRKWSADLAPNEERVANFWRLTATETPWWVDHADPQSDDEAPIFCERRLISGQPVTAIGLYDTEVGGLTSPPGSVNRWLRIYPNDAATVARRLRGQMWFCIFGGLIVLALLNFGAAKVLNLYRNSRDRQKELVQRLERAVTKSDLDAAKQVFERGLAVERAEYRGNVTPLMSVRDGAMADVLINGGIDVNAVNSDGDTALSQAVWNNRPDVVLVLVNRGANLNYRNPNTLDTAYMAALYFRRPKCLELLEQAGAATDTVAEGNGRALTPADGPYVVCRDYLRANHARDLAAMNRLVAPGRMRKIANDEWQSWQADRPVEPWKIEGHLRDNHATIDVSGSTPSGKACIWVFQLFRSDGRWLITHETEVGPKHGQ